MASPTPLLVRRSIIALAVAVAAIAVVVVAISLVKVIPNSAITRTAMGETSVRIGNFYQRHKRLPPDLNVLPAREGFSNRTTDAWRRPLIYAIVADDTFTLSSLGADGAAAGTGDNADSVRTYRIERGEVRELRAPP